MWQGRARESGRHNLRPQGPISKAVRLGMGRWTHEKPINTVGGITYDIRTTRVPGRSGKGGGRKGRPQEEERKGTGLCEHVRVECGSGWCKCPASFERVDGWMVHGTDSRGEEETWSINAPEQHGNGSPQSKWVSLSTVAAAGRRGGGHRQYLDRIAYYYSACKDRRSE